MTYQVLARKWRPRNFAEMVGQSHVLRALSNGLAQGRLHHAYLFTGTRGVGKTTVARILAKCLNCEAAGVTDKPCGECAACTEIDGGRFVDLIEVDAASRTKVEDTRDLLDNVQYAPTRGRFKIYLIDEVHMLSTHSFNALLKTLEEPPAHVKFLLATTDPQKLPVTVLSRCLQFNLKPLLPDMIAGQLQAIAQAEELEAEPAAINQIARAAEGSMRDALSLMDQAIAFGSGALRQAEVRDMLGSLEQSFVFELLEALADGDGATLLATIDRMAESSPDFAEALGEITAVLHRMGLGQIVPEVVTGDEADEQRLGALSERFDAAALQLLYQIALHGRRDLPLAPDPKAGFEMTMLRMLAFQPDFSADSSRNTSAKKPNTQPLQPPSPKSAAPKPAAPQPAESAPTAPQSAAPKPATSESAIKRPSAPVASATETDSAAVDWHQLVAALDLSGMAKALADHCDWGGREGERVTLKIEQGHDHLMNDNVLVRLEEALSAYFGSTLRLHLQVGEVSSETPAAAAERAAAERQSAAEQAIESDPNIQALKATFDAEIVPDSIRPRDQE